MFQSLKIALKRPKKIIVIFLLTIFIPSISLIFFGISALRNEKFRLEKQIENDQIQFIENLKNRINVRFNEISNQIESLTSHPSILDKDYTLFKNLVEKQFENEQMIDQVLLLYSNEDPFFPLFQTGLDNQNNSSVLSYDDFQLTTLRLAEDFEFQQKNYLNAILNYNKLFDYSRDESAKARALNCIVRNYTKLGKYRQALDYNLKIINEYPDIYTANGLPIILHAKLQAVECYQKLGELETAVNTAIDFYKELLKNSWDLNESRFYTYIDLTSETLKELLAEDIELNTNYNEQFRQLKNTYLLKTEEWQMINTIKSDIIPHLREISQNNSAKPFTTRFLKTIGGLDYMIIAALFQEVNDETNMGLIGIIMDRNFLENDFLKNEIENIGLLKNTAIHITNLSGNNIMGNNTEEKNLIKTTGFWDNNFPPWKIEVSYSGSTRLGTVNIFSSFFFWTIITLIFILVFGTTLVVRIIAREMELLKIKSDFVSSVSHEFKTPLTSMKALTERLEEGKVTQSEKMKQYLSHISYDIEKLIRLVRNILNFSKIEEGKKVYKLEKTDIATWLKQLINSYTKESLENDIKIHSQLANDIPELFIDNDAMTQAVFNLLDNAVKFSPQDKEVELTAEKNTNFVIIKVKDKGIGIENDESEIIFEKFYRGKSAVEYSINGTGLGLAIAKYTVKAHNGHITVTSEPGWSTVFTINIPIQNNM